MVPGGESGPDNRFQAGAQNPRQLKGDPMNRDEKMVKVGKGPWISLDAYKPMRRKKWRVFWDWIATLIGKVIR